jgi:hypothetical protein
MPFTLPRTKSVASLPPAQGKALLATYLATMATWIHFGSLPGPHIEVWKLSTARPFPISLEGYDDAKIRSIEEQLRQSDDLAFYLMVCEAKQTIGGPNGQETTSDIVMYRMWSPTNQEIAVVELIDGKPEGRLQLADMSRAVVLEGEEAQAMKEAHELGRDTPKSMLH